MPQAIRPTCTLHYEDTGGEGPPLVFLHGWCDGSQSWSAMLKAFAGEYRCLAPDMRGHARSEQPRDHGYSLEALSNDVVAVCEAAAVTDPVIIGHSYGGLLAALTADRYPGFPRAIVVEDQALDLRPLRARLKELEPVIFSADGHLPFRMQFFDSMVSPAMPDSGRALIGQLKEATPVATGQALWSQLFALTENEVAAFSAALVEALELQPSLVLHAEEDDAYFREVHAASPDAVVEVIPGGHWIHLERPEEFEAAVRRFLVTLGV